MQSERFAIPERFRGPPRSGNGGYVCGRVARHLPGTIAVRLKSPAPLGVEVRLESGAGEARLFHGSTLVAEARRGELQLAPAMCPTYAQAQSASQSYIGFKSHAFPGCFVCGPERSPGDGLRIFPGRVSGRNVLAAPWVPDASLADPAGTVGTEFIWSALDCPSAWAVFPLPRGIVIVLGELCASIAGGIVPGERCVVSAWPLEAEGRKRIAASAIHTEEGRLVAIAKAIWIEAPLSAWNT